MSEENKIWLATYYGVRSGILFKRYADCKKLLIEIPEPCLVDESDVFSEEKEAYAALAEREQKTAMEALRKASEYSKKAAGKK